MISIASFQAQAVFCAISGSRDISKTKWGMKLDELEILSNLAENIYLATSLFLSPGTRDLTKFVDFDLPSIIFCVLTLLIVEFPPALDIFPKSGAKNNC